MKNRLIKALRAKAYAERESALMSLQLMTENAVGIGDHTANDFINDGTIALQRLIDAEDALDTLEKFFDENGKLKPIY